VGLRFLDKAKNRHDMSEISGADSVGLFAYSRRGNLDAGRDLRVEGEGKMTPDENHVGAPAHPSLLLRVGAAAETSLLVGTLLAIWISVAGALIAAVLR